MAKKKLKDNLSDNLKLTTWVFLILSLLTPLIYNTRIMFPFSSARSFFFMAMIEIAFSSWLLLAIRDKRYRPKINPVTIIVSALFVSMILSTLLGADPFYSFWSNYERMFGLLIQLHVFALFVITSSLLKGEKDWVNLTLWLAPVATIVGFLSLLHNSKMIEMADYFKDGSTLGNTSFMGSYLLVALFFILYGLIKSRGGWRIYLALNGVIVALAIFFNSGGRAMRGGLFIGLVLALILWLSFENKRAIVRNLARVSLVIGLVLAIAIGALAFTENSPVRSKITQMRGMTARFVVWDIGWQGFKERPIFGYGPENFRIPFEKHFEPKLSVLDGKEIWFDRAHNIVFEKLVTLGAVGTILFFGSFLVGLFAFWRNYFKEKQEIWAPIAFTSLFAAYFVQNLTVFDMISSYMLLFLMLGFAGSLSPEREETDKKSIALPSIILSVLLLVSLNIFVLSPFKFGKDAVVAATSEPEEKTIDYYQRALQSPIGRDSLLFTLADNMVIKDKEDGIDRTVIEKMKFLMEELDKQVEIKPTFKKYWVTARLYNEYYSYNLLSQLLERVDETVVKEADEAMIKARELLEKGLAISPKNQQGYWDLVQTTVNEGNIFIFYGEIDKAKAKYEEAYRVAEKAIELEPRNIVAQLKYLKVIREVVQDDELLQEKLKEALEIDPSWEEHLKQYL